MPNPKMAIFFFLFFFFLSFFLFFFLMAIFFLFLYKVTHWIAFLKIKIEADWKVIYLTAFLPFANFTRPGHYLITPMLLRVSL